MKTYIDIAAEMRTRGLTSSLIDSLLFIARTLPDSEVKNVDHWLAEMKKLLPDCGGLSDLCAEGWFASVFSFNGFEVEMKPFGGAGPDLKLSDGEDVYVEVRRFREGTSKKDSHVVASHAASLEAYGDLEKDVKKVLDEIIGKSKQGKLVPAGVPYLVALKSDKESIEEVEFEQACDDLSKQAVTGAAYHGISGVLFYDGWVNIKRKERWYLWSNPNASVQLSNHIRGRLAALQLPPSERA